MQDWTRGPFHLRACTETGKHSVGELIRLQALIVIHSPIPCLRHSKWFLRGSTPFMLRHQGVEIRAQRHPAWVLSNVKIILDSSVMMNVPCYSPFQVPKTENVVEFNYRVILNQSPASLSARGDIWRNYNVKVGTRDDWTQCHQTHYSSHKLAVKYNRNDQFQTQEVLLYSLILLLKTSAQLFVSFSRRVCK